ncbi:MAG: hypothetical protein J6W82_01625 [Bacteroidales bacterium]|nr:hypothetical protein [Bacteroidales bacterium]
MKKIAIFMAALLTLSCAQKEVVIDDQETPAEKDGVVEYVLRSDGNIDMKATIDMDNGGLFSWSAGDCIAVLNTTDNKFYAFSAEAADGVFKANVPAGANFTVSYYPASLVMSAAEISAGVSATVSNVNAVTLPTSYTLAEAAAGKTFAMRGAVSGDVVSFAHMGALIRVTVKDVPAEANAIVLSSTKTIAGDFTATEDSGKYVIAAGTTASNVEVTFTHSAKEDMTVYFPLPVGTFDYTLTVTDGTHTMLSQSTKSDKTFARANYAKMSPLTVAPASTDKKLIGLYKIGDTAYNWGTESLLAFTALDGHWGWFKATIGVPEYMVDFKLYKEDGGVYIGNSVSNERKIVGTMIGVAAEGAGDNFSIYTNRSAIDVYYEPEQNRLFTLPAGADFVIPTTEAGSAVDEYAAIGWFENNDWNADFFLEAIYNFDDWRVVRIGARGDDPHMSFKFRRNGGWSDQVGSIYKYNRQISTCYYGKTSNGVDFDVFPGAAGQYDVYLKSDFSTVFVLPAGTAFNIPGRKEQEDLVSLLYIIGGINGHNWDQNYPLEFASTDNHEWYALKNATKISGWGAMVFKIYNGAWGAGYNVGWPSSLDGAIGDVSTVYPLYLRDSDADIPNIQLNTEVSGVAGEVDIYIKADLSEIFTLPAGSQFVVPTPVPTVPPKAVFIGDSITYFWDNASRGNPSFFTSNNFITKGVEGQTSATIKNRFNYDVISNSPEKVHILCGTNDLAGNGGTYVAPAEICQNIADMAAAAAAAGIEVFIGSVLPCNYLWWNTSVNPADNIVTLNGLLKALCTEKGYTYVNYYDAMVGNNGGLADAYNIDGCHPSQAGYTVMEGIVLPLINN